MNWAVQRPFSVKPDYQLQLKMGLTDLAMFFEFHSKSSDTARVSGRSGLYKLFLAPEVTLEYQVSESSALKYSWIKTPIIVKDKAELNPNNIFILLCIILSFILVGLIILSFGLFVCYKQKVCCYKKSKSGITHEDSQSEKKRRSSLQTSNRSAMLIIDHLNDFQAAAA